MGAFFDTFDWPFVSHPGEFDGKILKFVKSPPLARTRLTARKITDNNFEISLVVFMPNITTNHAITYIYGTVIRTSMTELQLKDLKLPI